MGNYNNTQKSHCIPSLLSSAERQRKTEKKAASWKAEPLNPSHHTRGACKLQKEIEQLSLLEGITV